MGSGAGQAAGLGMLGQFDHKQPVISLCGDSTFFHASIPALIDAVYHKSNMIQIVFDNDVTAMTGLQPHPGVPYDGLGELDALLRSLIPLTSEEPPRKCVN
ncbi:MAG: hypothetical protein JRJ02_16495 [Deltaproteobacteria bacterium]|nr:hypothetical protein [Deltaproteobacteria bacterium]